MATPIASIIDSVQLTPPQQAVYLKEFQSEINMIDFKMYENLGKKRTLPNHMYGDTTNTGDTGGDAMRTANVYTSQLDGFKITVWDDLAFIMNYGFRLDDLDNSDGYGADLDYNFRGFQIDEGTGYGNAGSGATNYRIHDKALTNKFYVNVPIIRFGATNQWDTLCVDLIPTEESKQLIKEFGKQAKMVQGQYIRATLLNGGTIHTLVDVTAATPTAYQNLQDALVAAKRDMKMREGAMFVGAINATDKVGTNPVKGGYIAIINTLCEDVVSNLPDFIDVVDYSSQVGLFENEYGALRKHEIRFVVNNLLVRDTAADISGADALGVSDRMDATGLDIGRYNIILMAKDAYTVASLAGKQRYQIFIDGPGKGNDTLRIEKNMGWKAILGCAVHRPAWLHVFPVLINALT